MLPVYLVIINALAFVLMHMDKEKARKGKWRIPEATLLGIAAAGGSIGALFGMHLFRHKTKHIRFSAGIPAMMFVHILLLLWLIKG